MMRHSIIRRSVALTSFYVAGHGFYYLLLLIANAMLDPSGFGRLYTGWAILNVLVAPISIIALLLSGKFAEANSVAGTGIRCRAACTLHGDCFAVDGGRGPCA